MRRWLAASLLVVAALYGHVAAQPLIAASLAVLAAVALFTRAEVDVGVGAQRLLTGLAAALGLAAGWLYPEGTGDVLRKPFTALALAGLCAGVARLFMRPAPPAFALLPGLVALMAAGETNAGAAYVAAVAAWLAAGIAALRSADPGRPAVRDLPGRDRLRAIALVAAGAALAYGSAIGLPPLSQWVERRVVGAFAGPETGFSDRLELGSLDGMLDSDEIVMRVRGPRTDYLRGAVFDRYERGRWSRSGAAEWRPAVTSSAPGSAGRIRITVASGKRDRYFLPLGAAALSARGAGLVADRFGVVRVDAGTATEASFAPRGEPAHPPAAPGVDDFDLPPALRRALTPVAAEWTRGAGTPEAKVAAIAEHLQAGFTYSRKFERRRADPVLDFLFDDKRGHCEYFATALALLSRAAGVPARVAVGYRVAEENEIGHYWVVRERNAHAWTEVHIPGKGFVTVDATPEDLLAQNAPHRTGFVRALLDLGSTALARAIARLTLVDAIIAGSAAVVAGLFVRWWRRRRKGRRREGPKLVVDRPPPSLLRLLDALARRGVARDETEPVERYAERVGALGMERAAELLRRWAALRYGGIGDGEDLARETAGAVERLGAEPPQKQ